jgi:CRP-like cAMP-binding protein
VLERIRAIPMLAGLSEGRLQSLIDSRELYWKRYSKGAAVYHRQDDCRTFDIVLEGSLAVYALSENGSAMTMFEFSKGHTLGANLLFGDMQVYPFTIHCLSDAQLLHITKRAVSAFLHDYAFTLQFVGLLSQNAQKLNQKITMATQKTLRENILDYLGRQAALQRTDCIVLPISKKQLADHLGVQRPSLFRELKRLREEGVISVSNRTVCLLRRT